MKKKIQTVNLYTPEGEKFISERPAVPWNVYPRPHMQRESFFCLNGTWKIRAIKEKKCLYDGEIIVPFVPESILSGVGEVFDDGVRLCYYKKFSLPEGFIKGRVLLHFGAVDQIAYVRLNGKELGSHRGGYHAFSFDITDCLADVNVLEVSVVDELDKKILPYGKQCRKRGGMWYTPISGIWQTVWLESVPEKYIREIRITTDQSGADVYLDGDGELSGMVELGNERFYIKDGHARVNVKQAHLWTPDDPYLYEIRVRVGADAVSSYFALRTLGTASVKGKNRLLLNGEPCFFHGLLDQGYFSDGIFLPADPSGYERDILEAKRLGFNMLRKHIKVEPEIFYYLCDKLGMVVFQDMVNNSDYSFLRDTALPTVGVKRLDDKKLHRNEASREAFIREMEETVRKLSFHPSVCYYTIFNEGWGQFDHASAYERLRSIDSSRVVDSVSGWFVPTASNELRSDVESIHVYFKEIKLSEFKTDKPWVISEFGGYSHKIEGHSFNLKQNYGYRTFADKEAFESALSELYMTQVLPLVREGVCACVYTQLADVEDETNGLMTYDRKVVKVSIEKMNEISKALSEAVK